MHITSHTVNEDNIEAIRELCNTGDGVNQLSFATILKAAIESMCIN